MKAEKLGQSLSPLQTTLSWLNKGERVLCRGRPACLSQAPLDAHRAVTGVDAMGSRNWKVPLLPPSRDSSLAGSLLTLEDPKSHLSAGVFLYRDGNSTDNLLRGLTGVTAEPAGQVIGLTRTGEENLGETSADGRKGRRRFGRVCLSRQCRLGDSVRFCFGRSCPLNEL